MVRRVLVGIFLFVGMNAPLFSDEPRLLPTSFPLPGPELMPRSIGIGLMINVPSASVGTVGPYRIKTTAGQIVAQATLPLDSIVRPTVEGIQVNDRVFGIQSLVFESDDHVVRAGKRQYVGTIRIVRHSERAMTVVNDIEIEEYLKGVLPLEVSPAWPIESLKAQAVVSRTFAIFKAIEKRNQDFVMSDTILGQVYGGSLFHKAETDRAVRETEGQILTFNNEIISTYFHAACGGQTAQPEKVWRLVPNPALKSVSCNFCHGTKHYRWSFHMPLLELERLMKRNGYPADGLRDVVFTDREISGRATKVFLRYEHSEASVSADSLRALLGYDRLRSLKVDAQVGDRREVYFRGLGWGHGIGFCQWGSKRQAELGMSYREIVQYYFPGSVIQKIGGSPTNADEESDLLSKIAGGIGSLMGRLEK